MQKALKSLKGAYIYFTSTKQNKENDETLEELKHTLVHQGLEEKDVTFVLQNGEKFFGHPDYLAEKLSIEISRAENALNELRKYRNKKVSPDEMKRFEGLLKENPNEDPTKIGLLNEIEESVVTAYLESLESKPLSESQKLTIIEKFTTGFSIQQITDHSGISQMKVKEFIESELMTFTGKEGKRVFGILTKHFGEYPLMKLRDLIITKNAKLQDQICYELPKLNEEEYDELKNYFMKFEESRYFFVIDEMLSFEARESIRASGLDDIEELSKRLNISERLIKDYILQYDVDESLILYNTEEQIKMLHKVVMIFGFNELISHTTYKTIISESFDDLIQNAKELKMEPNMILSELMPLALYYIKCSLPLEEFSQIITNLTSISFTTLDLFHSIFQMSDPIVRGLCIEHYSFSNPVPLYYPKIGPNNQDQALYQFEICKELWYSVQQFNGLVSFGLGWASWNPIGKSHLLDLLFETDFGKGSPQNSAFHKNSIDIQMTKNLYGNKQKNKKEQTQWAYIDCHGYSDYNVISHLSQNLDITLIHVTYFDFQENYSRMEEDLCRMTCGTKRIYVLIRDYPENEIKVEQTELKGIFCELVFIPHVIKDNPNLRTSLKKLGYEILHSISEEIRLFDSFFLEQLIANFDAVKLLVMEKELVQKILNHISTNEKFSSLSYYSYFIEFMRCYYNKCRETDQKAINELNENYKMLHEKLSHAKMNQIVWYFNEIIGQQNSTLILWKLAQELKNNTKEYSLEIFWREALLTKKYNDSIDDDEAKRFAQEFSLNFSIYVERGEPFELIDGDNLRFFNKDINDLLYFLYEKQSSDDMKAPPIVISIFGPQSSGKSTLLNYCFGCKFLTSAGRCTKGVYASLSKLSQPINNSDHFLILDTEGLDSIEKGKVLKETSCIHFDRTMVLFCLAVSQVVIINIKGEIGEDLRNLLQICAYSLHKLKVSKVPTPKIFFVLNQQADPDPLKHLSSINTLLEDLNRESFLMETEGIDISDLIHVSRENLFVLPSAFNSVSLNTHMAKLFDSDLRKLNPTDDFANKCAELKMSIIQQLKNEILLDIQGPFRTMSEWLEMSGVIWDTIVKYQDIVKYRNFDELKCSHLLEEIVSNLLKNKIYLYKKDYQKAAEDKIRYINDEITTWSPPNGIFEDLKKDLDEIFNEKKEGALAEFENQCQSHPLLKKMTYMCDDAKANMCRLIYIEKKIYEDKLKFEIKARLTELKLSENMMKFQKYIHTNADKFFELSIEQRTSEFEKIWSDCFESDNKTEGEAEINEIFNDMYSVFSIESKSMENKNNIYTFFRELNFEMDKIIQKIQTELLTKFCSEKGGTGHFIFVCKENKLPLKDMKPYSGKKNFRYFCKTTLWTPLEVQKYLCKKKSIFKFQDWVSSSYYTAIEYFSGHFNDPDIIWETDKNKQILLLASQLKDPNDTERSTWKRLIYDITKGVTEFIEKDSTVSHSTVREIVDYLCQICKLVNYEINFIEAKLTNTAERRITTFAFCFVFKSILDTKFEKQMAKKAETNKNKGNNLNYFLQKIENRKMTRGNWDRPTMRKGDTTIGNKFARDLLEAIWRSVYTECKRGLREDYFDDKKDLLSHRSLLLLANKKITEELNTGSCQITPFIENNFLVQFICNQSLTLKKLFQEEWLKSANELHDTIIEKMNKQFLTQKSNIQAVLMEFLNGMDVECKRLDRTEEIGLDSDSNFVATNSLSEDSNSDPKTREAPFNAMVLFLEMYLNPKVSPEEFNQFFNNPFEIDGVIMEKKHDTYVLYEKPSNSGHVLDEELFKKLAEIKMFSNTETIFNIRIYVEEFLHTLTNFKFQVTQVEYEKLLASTKEEFELRIINCPNRCPSCGKFCEREIHPNDGKCQLLTGHQICSMGGRVWNTNTYRTAILLMCEDYRDDSPVFIPGQNIKWWEFKEKCADQWDWSIPQDEMYVDLQKENRIKNQKIWNKYGKVILEYYSNKGTHISYIPYTSYEEIYKSLFSLNSYVCFLIDGTDLMGEEIKYANHWVSEHLKILEGISNFRVVIYHGNCRRKNFIEAFPNNSDFTPHADTIQNFLANITTYGKQSDETALLHGLAAAATESNWETGSAIRNIIVHIFIEPTKGYYNPLKAIHNCPFKCHFNWKRDIGSRIDEFKINYKCERILNFDHPEAHLCQLINFDDKCVDLSSEKKFKSEVFIDYKPVS